MRNSLFWAVIVAVGLAFVVASRLTISNEYFYFAGYVVLEYIVLSTAWNILGGYTGYTNFGTGAFFAIGAYSSAVLHKLPALLLATFQWKMPQVPLPVMIVVGGLVSGLIGLGTGYLTLRLRGVFFAIATLALSIVVQTLIVNWDFVGGSRGIYIIRPANAPLGGGYIQYLFTLMTLLAVVSVGVARTIERSRLGLGFAAIRDDELAAEASGVPTLRLKLISTTLSGALMGMAGAPLPYYVTYLDPASSFNLSYAVNSVAMPVIGGMMSWIGPVIGSILLGTIQQLATVTISSAINLLIVGVLLILFVIAAPNGIADLLQGPAGGPFAPTLSRVQFFIRWLITCAVMAVILVINSIALLLLFGFIAITVYLAIASQRLRDMAWSGWLALLLFVPLVNIVLLFILFFAPGRMAGEDVALAGPSAALREGQTRG
jgi:branched-chain amino acid transport system permease protein